MSISVSYMYSFSAIFKPLRNYISYIPYIRRPLSCPECSSFWFGLMISFLYNPIALDIQCLLLTNIFCGLVTHLFASFLYKKTENHYLLTESKANKKVEFIN